MIHNCAYYTWLPELRFLKRLSSFKAMNKYMHQIQYSTTTAITHTALFSYNFMRLIVQVDQNKGDVIPSYVTPNKSE